MTRKTARVAARPVAVAVGCAIAVSCYAALDLEGAEAIWLFDDAKGKMASDSSGNEHEADFVGEPEWVDGMFGSALLFDGEDDHAEVDGWSSPEMNDFTLGAWVKPESEHQAFATILDSHQEPPRRGVGLEQNNVSHNLFWTIWGDGNAWNGGGTQTQLTAGEWQHFVGVRVGGDSTHYLNGEVSKSGLAGLEDPVAAGDSNFRIANWVLGGRHYAGAIDEAFLFSRALTEAEVILLGKGFDAVLEVSPKAKLTTTWASMKTAQ